MAPREVGGNPSSRREGLRVVGQWNGLHCWIFSVLMFAVVSASLAHAQTKPSTSSAGLRIDILGLRSDQGQVACSLFNDAKAFPRDGDKVYREVWVPIQADHAVCMFNDIPA